MTTERGSGRGISEGAPVYVANGDQLGTVNEVRGRNFKVDALRRRDYWLPLDAISRGSAPGEVRLTFTEDRLAEYTIANPDEETSATATAVPAGTPHVKQSPVPGPDTEHLPTPPRGDDTERARTTEHELELNEEQLHVPTQREAAGVVRLRTQVVEDEESLEVPVRKEVLVIECVGGTGKVMVGDRELSVGETVELTLYRERATAHTEVVVTEEVTARTMETQQTEQLQGTVRTEHLAVDDPQGRVVGDVGTDVRSNDERGGRKTPRRSTRNA